MKISQLFLPSASYLPTIAYPGASFLFHVLVSLKVFAEGLRHFENSAGPTQLIPPLTPSHPLITLYIKVSTNLLHTDFTAYWSGLLWMTWSPEKNWYRISHFPGILNKSSYTQLIVQQFHPPQVLGEYHLIPATDNVNFVYLHHHLIYRHFSLRQMKAQQELHSFFCYEFSCPKCIF